MFDRRTLGIDPGLSRCGLAVVDGPAVRAQVVATDVVRTPADMGLGDRLRQIHEALEQAIAAHHPSSLAVERVFINAQARTVVGAVQVVGLVHLLGAVNGLPVSEYTPSQVKAAVTGVGDADKEQITFMVQRMLGLSEAPRPADRADALAVALCHLQQAGHVGAIAAAALASGSPATGAAGVDPALAGLPPRLAAALANAGPGLQAITPSPRPPTGATP